MKQFFATLCLLAASLSSASQLKAADVTPAEGVQTDAASCGFSPDGSGVENVKALQAALDKGGTVTIFKPGTYKIAGTAFIGSNTSLICSPGVIFQKVNERGVFSHILLNKGALTKTWDKHIRVEGLQVSVNGIDSTQPWQVFGLRGQLAFFYVRDLRISGFRCDDLGSNQFCIHVCTFEDLLVSEVNIKGKKDGVHLGHGKRFTIRNGTFQTGDDAVALNAHDYATSNPELGCIEDGLVENCQDLADPSNTAGFFCRILAGSWMDWKEGMEVQQADTVVSEGRLYRVKAQSDGMFYKSLTRPTHDTGEAVLDGIKWVMVQKEAIYSAGVRNVTFRNIMLLQPRPGFSIHLDSGKFSRSYYPGSVIPKQENIRLENITVKEDKPLLITSSPIDTVTIVKTEFNKGGIRFQGGNILPEYLPTKLLLTDCTFTASGPMDLVVNTVTNKVISLETKESKVLNPSFTASVRPGPGTIEVNSDLPGLKK